MVRVRLGWLVLLLGLGVVVCGPAESLASAQPSAVLPPGTPRWLVPATQQAARGLGDPKATLTDARLGRFPIVVIRGSFRCYSCPTPFGGAVPTGRYATLTLDAVTHAVRDFALSRREPGKLTALCSGDCAGRRTVVLASAQEALDGTGFAVILGERRGRHRCLLSSRQSTSGFIAATCRLTMAFGRRHASVTFTETWTGRDPSGRRYSADSPILSHVWRIVETADGWVTKLGSTGNAPPR